MPRSFQHAERVNSSKHTQGRTQRGGGICPPPPEIFKVQLFYKDIEDCQTFQQHGIHEILILFMYKGVFSGDLKRARSQKNFLQLSPRLKYPLYGLEHTYMYFL